MFLVTKMFSRKLNSIRTYAKSINPIQRTLDAITGNIRDGISENKTTVYPEHADVVIIGGGFIGSSAAYWLKTKAGAGLNVVVLDKAYNQKLDTMKMPTGLISHHYSLPENILLSQFSADFLRNANEKLGKNINVKFQPHGYLVLASEQYCDILERNVSVLKEYGVKNELLSVEQMKKRYPWMELSDIKLGCLSTEGEGAFDSFTLLRGLIEKSVELGANYVNGDVIGMETEHQKDVLMEGVKQMSFKRINKILYRTEDNEERAIKFAICVLAAGAESTSIAKFAQVGNDSGLLSVSLPVEERQFNIYSLGENSTKSIVGLNSPYIMDTSGLWLRRNGLKNNIICGQIPLKSDESLSKDENYGMLFKPSLQNRFPSFSDVEVNNLDSEVYDYNTYDDSGIIGPHPYHTNLVLATGFGKLGIQHSPGIGRAISELIIEGHYISNDLTRLGFDRMLVNEPLIEFNIY